MPGGVAKKAYWELEDIDELTYQLRLGLSKRTAQSLRKTAQADVSLRSNKSVDFVTEARARRQTQHPPSGSGTELVPSEQIESLQYLDVEHFAEIFVDDVIDLSVQVCEKMFESTQTVDESSAMSMSKPCVCDKTCKNQPQAATSEGIRGVHIDSNVSYASAHKSFSGWPSIRSFTINSGVEKITEYMDQWDFQEDWKYNVRYITSYSDLVSDFHLYEGMWSIPTKEYPIAQATATVFFTIEVSRVKPKFCRVEVTMQFEGSNSSYRAGEFEFMEQWLFNIVDSKLNFFKTLRF